MSTEVVTTPKGTAELDLFDSGQFGRAMELAKALSTATGWVPKHLLGNPGACLGIVSLASAWRVNPFLLAAGTADIHGKLLFEAKAVQAGIERSGALQGRLTFALVGDWSKVRGKFAMVPGRQTGDDGQPKLYAKPSWTPADEEGLAIDVTGVPAGTSEPVTDRTWLKACHPRNSTLWGTDPETQCRYRATRNWARKVLPAVMLGAVTQDEYEPPAEINVTSTGTDAPVAKLGRAAKRAEQAKKEEASPPVETPKPAPENPVPYTFAAAKAALESAGCPLDQFLAWAVGTGRIAGARDVDALSQDVLECCVTQPQTIARAVSAWRGAQDAGK